MPIVNYEKRLQTALDHLDKIDITTQNKHDIKAFVDYIATHGGGTARQCKYIYPLENLARWLQKDFMHAGKVDIEHHNRPSRNKKRNDYFKSRQLHCTIYWN